jgi:hypothetical protein
MQPHQERVVKEKGDLDFKIQKLSEFNTGDVYLTLDEAEQYRLSRQLTYMCQYSEVLGDRIDAF